VNDYRSGARCEFCDEMAVAFCARCQCHACAMHDGAPWCRACQKEALDDAEVARFQSSVTMPEGGLDGRRAAPVFEIVVGWLGRVVFRRGKAPPQRAFAARTPEDIRAWRRTAGLKTRS
jgi:hypothetical protein